jgi:hypothetical protein
MSARHPQGDDRLIELLLDRAPEARRELAALRADPGAAARLAALERLLAGAAAAVEAPQDRAREHALAERVLALTTREDLSWRGDLRLVGGFLRERMRESRLARSLAALLVANLTIGPVVAVAWVLVHEPEPQRRLYFHVEPSEPDLREDAAAEDAGLAPLPEDVPEIEGLARIDRLAAQHVENRLRRARYLLAPAHGRVPAPAAEAPGADAPLALRLLDARARTLGGQPWPAWLDDAAWEHGHGGDLTAAALYAELLLDRYARQGDRAPRFHPALAHLAARERSAEADGAPAAVRRLAAAALARAASYGLFEEATATAEDPLGAAWRADLADALGELATAPAARGWSAR